MATMIGPFGGAGGQTQDIDTSPVGLKRIDIWSTNGSGGLINAISFTYVDSNKKDTMSSLWGNAVGVKNPVVIPPSVYVTRLSGTFNDNRVNSLTIVTSDGTTNGPFGDPSAGKSFDIPVVKSSIVAFFGRSDQLLNAVGAYVYPQSARP